MSRRHRQPMPRLCTRCIHAETKPLVITDSYGHKQGPSDVLACRRTRKLDVVTGIIGYPGSVELNCYLCRDQRKGGWLWARMNGFCGQEGRYYKTKPAKQVFLEKL